MFNREKLTKEEKKWRKKYLKMLKKHQKELDSLNKVAHRAPWDWSFGLDYLIAYMEFMQEYYDLGWNVCQSDESLTLLKKTLKEALDAYKEWSNFNTEFFHPESYRILDQEYHDLCQKENKKILINEEMQYIEEHMPSEEWPFSEENLKKFNKLYKQKRNKFFKLLGDHIERWWD